MPPRNPLLQRCPPAAPVSRSAAAQTPQAADDTEEPRQHDNHRCSPLCHEKPRFPCGKSQQRLLPPRRPREVKQRGENMTAEMEGGLA